MNRELFIIGCGPGDPGFITRRGAELIGSCDEVYAFDRIGDLYQACRRDIIQCAYLDIEDQIRSSDAAKTAVLVSGDVGFFSMAKTLNEKFSSGFQVSCVCGISSLQYLCSKIKMNYEMVKTVSLHGRDANLPGSIAYNRYTFVLTGGKNNATAILGNLVKNGMPDIRVTAGERLSMPNERILSGTVEALSRERFDSLTVLLFENDHAADREAPLFDRELSRNETPMTKQEVRWAAVNMLGIRPCDILYDIGAGSGSVAIEMARKAHEGLVFAVEKEERAYELLCRNKSDLGALNVVPVLGEALEEIRKLPVPDKAFIGGSGGSLAGLVRHLFEANRKIRIVVTAITLETLGTAMTVFRELDFVTDVVCLNCARSKKTGGYHMMTANNPVYILCGEKNEAK